MSSWNPGSSSINIGYQLDELNYFIMVITPIVNSCKTWVELQKLSDWTLGDDNHIADNVMVC